MKCQTLSLWFQERFLWFNHHNSFAHIGLCSANSILYLISVLHTLVHVYLVEATNCGFSAFDLQSSYSKCKASVCDKKSKDKYGNDRVISKPGRKRADGKVRNQEASNEGNLNTFNEGGAERKSKTEKWHTAGDFWQPTGIESGRWYKWDTNGKKKILVWWKPVTLKEPFSVTGYEQMKLDLVTLLSVLFPPHSRSTLQKNLGSDSKALVMNGC